MPALNPRGNPKPLSRIARASAYRTLFGHAGKLYWTALWPERVCWYDLCVIAIETSKPKIVVPPTPEEIEHVGVDLGKDVEREHEIHTDIWP